MSKTTKSGVSQSQGEGAQSMHKFSRIFAQEHPQTTAFNAYVKHLQATQLGWAIFIPDNETNDVFDFKSTVGHLRVINRHEAAPIYTHADWASLQSSSNIVLVDGKNAVLPSRELLDRRQELRVMSRKADGYAQLIGNAREIGVVEQDEKVSAKEVIRRVLASEFSDQKAWIDRLEPPAKKTK